MKPRKSCKCQQGIAALEFAILLIILLLIVGGIVEFGRAFWHLDALTKATRDGARMLSVADRATFSTGGFIDLAKNRVVMSANAARIDPELSVDQVSVTCLDVSYNPSGCGSGANAPEYVRVAIEGYEITIGSMVPFLSPTGTVSIFRGIALAPSTTMPYMK